VTLWCLEYIVLFVFYIQVSSSNFSYFARITVLKLQLFLKHENVLLLGLLKDSCIVNSELLHS